ncbi:hypothetical protein PSPHG_CDS_0130 [Pseudomonas phage Psxphi15]
MIFATVLSLCLMSNPDPVDGCNDYIVDVATTQGDCLDNLINHSTRMANVWHDGKKLSAFLKEFHIVEPVSQLSDYDYTCRPVADRDIP